MRSISFLSLIVFLAFGLTNPLSAQSSELPEEVASFYQYHNLAFALSTPSERVEFAEYSSAEEAMEKTGSERLGRVYAALEKTKARLLEVDPEMVMDPVPKAHPERNEVARLLKVDEVAHVSDDKVYVKAVGYVLGPGASMHFIRRYEHKEPGDRIEEFYPWQSLSSRQEVHTWVKRDGTWYRNRPFVQYLSQGI